MIISKARDLLVNLLEAGDVDAGHGIDHAETVLGHTNLALQHEDLSEFNKTAIQLAALLHDADDSKFFPDNTDHQNARYILQKIGVSDEQSELVIRMIGLVSCSKNGNTLVEPEWLLIPRFADRLEAMGHIGIVRCWQYSKHKNRPLFLDSTPRPHSNEQVQNFIMTERFSKYSGGSDSMMDHFYDKLLHLINMGSTNKYIITEAKVRHQILIEFCVQFGNNGFVDEEDIKSWI